MAVIEQAAFPVLAALGGQGAEFWELDVIELLQPGGPAGVVGLVGVEILTVFGMAVALDEFAAGIRARVEGVGRAEIGVMDLLTRGNETVLPSGGGGKQCGQRGIEFFLRYASGQTAVDLLKLGFASFDFLFSLVELFGERILVLPELLEPLLDHPDVTVKFALFGLMRAQALQPRLAFGRAEELECFAEGAPLGPFGGQGCELLASLWQRRVAEAALAPPIEPGVEIARKEFKPLVFAADGDLLGFACGAEASETLHCRG